MPSEFTTSQLEVINSPFNSRIFLQGQAGTGKTTTAVERLIGMLQKGVAGESILIITPQRTLASPYINALENYDFYSGGQVTNLTVGGLARRMIGLFWPLVSKEAGFIQPNHPPTFLPLKQSNILLLKLFVPCLTKDTFHQLRWIAIDYTLRLSTT